MMIYIRRRLAMCARKLGKLKEAVADVSRIWPRKFPPISCTSYSTSMRTFSRVVCWRWATDVQAVLAKYDDISIPSPPQSAPAVLLKASHRSGQVRPTWRASAA